MRVIKFFLDANNPIFCEVIHINRIELIEGSHGNDGNGD